VTAAVLIRELVDAGIRLSRNGDRLRVEAPKGALTADLKAVLTEHKAELLDALSIDPRADLRAKLEGMAYAEGVDPRLVRNLPDDDIAACAGLDDEVLIVYVRALRDTDLRERGKRPDDETAVALCQFCGPVWAHPAIVAVAPILDGWPRVLGCPWCHVRNRRAMARPPVTCGKCQHFARGTMNPAQGCGRCAVGCDPDRPYPFTKRECEGFTPRLRWQRVLTNRQC
jgi:hypothetical protein